MRIKCTPEVFPPGQILLAFVLAVAIGEKLCSQTASPPTAAEAIGLGYLVSFLISINRTVQEEEIGRHRINNLHTFFVESRLSRRCWIGRFGSLVIGIRPRNGPETLGSSGGRSLMDDCLLGHWRLGRRLHVLLWWLLLLLLM